MRPRRLRVWSRRLQFLRVLTSLVLVVAIISEVRWLALASAAATVALTLLNLYIERVLWQDFGR